MHSGLGGYDLIAFLNITDASGAKEFYGDKLGLHLVREDLPFALVFNANGIMLRLAINKEVKPVHGTVLGWQVPDARAAVESLVEAGIHFERYEFMTQDDHGIWTSPSAAKVAWFKDPDGNLLSISEHPELK